MQNSPFKEWLQRRRTPTAPEPAPDLARTPERRPFFSRRRDLEPVEAIEPVEVDEKPTETPAAVQRSRRRGPRKVVTGYRRKLYMAYRKARRSGLKRPAAMQQARIMAPAMAPGGDITWAWFLEQVDNARQDRRRSLMQPWQARGPNAVILLRHLRRWWAMQGRRPSLTQVATALVAPSQAFGEAYIRVDLIERMDEVEPEIPTFIGRFYRPKAAVADQTHKWRCDTGENVMRSRHSYMRLGLPPGFPISEILTMAQLDDMDLQEDDYRMEDILHVDRRAANRGLAASGAMAEQVDSLREQGPPWWMALLYPAIGAGAVAGSAVIYVISASGG